MENVIQTENLTKIYPGGLRALDRLDLEVQRGEIFGYLGPNGAGKTTTIRLLLDFIRPTAGRAALLGQDARRDSIAIKRRVGYLPGELNLWDKQTAQQIIQFIGAVRGGYDAAYVAALAERLQFDLSKKVRSYSSGNKRKLGLIIALMNKPDLLILDEPSTGLDPLMQQTFYQLMEEVRAEGRTVFLSSHILSEVQTICDRVAILRGGQLQTVLRVDDLTRTDFRHVTLRFREVVDPAIVAGVPGVSAVASSAGGRTLQLQLAGDFDPLLRAISPFSCRMSKCSSRRWRRFSSSSMARSRSATIISIASSRRRERDERGRLSEYAAPQLAAGDLLGAGYRADGLLHHRGRA